MKVILWNTRGARSMDFTRSIKDLVANNKANMMIVMETKVSCIQVEKSMARIGWKIKFNVDPVGFFTGGILVLWKDDEVKV